MTEIAVHAEFSRHHSYQKSVPFGDHWPSNRASPLNRIFFVIHPRSHPIQSANMSEASSSYEEIIAEPTDNATHTRNSNNATEAVETQLQELLQSLLDLSIIVYDFQPDGNRLVWNKM